MLVALLIITVLFLILCSRYRSPCRTRGCNCPQCNKKNRQAQIQRVGVKSQNNPQKGLHEIQQDTLTRGIVPHLNQPNHVSNRWKVEYSHPNVDQSGRSQTSFSSDCHTPMRNSRSNIGVNENSSMYLVSRFAVE